MAIVTRTGPLNVSTRRLFTKDLMFQRKMAMLSHIDPFFHSARNGWSITQLENNN